MGLAAMAKRVTSDRLMASAVEKLRGLAVEKLKAFSKSGKPKTLTSERMLEELLW